MSDSDDTIPYNIEEVGEPREREQSPSPIPPPCPTPPLEAGKTVGGATERLGGPQRGGQSKTWRRASKAWRKGPPNDLRSSTRLACQCTKMQFYMLFLFNTDIRAYTHIHLFITGRNLVSCFHGSCVC